MQSRLTLSLSIIALTALTACGSNDATVVSIDDRSVPAPVAQDDKSVDPALSSSLEQTATALAREVNAIAMFNDDGLATSKDLEAAIRNLEVEGASDVEVPAPGEAELAGCATITASADASVRWSVRIVDGAAVAEPGPCTV